MRCALVALLAAGLVACSEDEAASQEMRLVSFPSDPGETLLLNEEFTLIFDGVLDPSTVNRHTLSLRGAGGREAAGDWKVVNGTALEFSPAPILERDLTGGGFEPGEQLELILRGFPAPSGLRSLDGRWLIGSQRIHLRVVDRDAPGFMFHDATPNRSSPLKWRQNDPGLPLGRPLEPGEPLVLECLEPIDPSSLDDEYFWIFDERLAVAFPVRLELLRNFDDEQVATTLEPRALLALHLEQSSGRPLEPGTYTLKGGVGAGSRPPTDFRGGTVARLPHEGLKVIVGSEEQRDEVALEFVEDQDALPLVLEGSDGTAFWSSDGRVSVRYPAAAGDGSAGRVTLEGRPLEQRDLRATRLDLPAGVVQDLPAEGLVVLRAQGRMELTGRLRRRVEGAAPRPMFERGLGGPKVRQGLSQFLAAAAQEDAPWTVIIAGGDLVIDGVVEVDSPTLLVAGGRVRGGGHVTLDGAAQKQLWILGEGGFDATLDPPRRMPPSRAPGLDMDAPLENPLREPLVYSVVSSPLPRNETPGRWREHEAIGGGTEGEWLVHFAPRELPPGDVVGRSVLVSRPWELPSGACRVVIELRILARPGAGASAGPDGVLDPPAPAGLAMPWDPPFVDRVRLAWSPR
ncbi:MAG: hypothetical protein R3F49_03350 [Planctomycetota bacterium]